MYIFNSFHATHTRGLDFLVIFISMYGYSLRVIIPVKLKLYFVSRCAKYIQPEVYTEEFNGSRVVWQSR